MIEGLSNLSATAGVRGVVVFDEADNCLASVLHPPYEAGFIIDAIKRLFTALDVFTSLREGAVSDVSLNCDGGGIIARCTNPHTIVALVEPKTNPNMLNVAMNVVAMNLARSSGVPRSMGAVPIQPSNLDSRASHNSLTGPTSSRILTNSGESDLEIPLDAVPRTKVLAILDSYRLFMGPAAKLVFKQELEHLGVTSRTLRQAQMEDFLKRLARHIPNLDRQQQFIHSALGAA